METGMTPQSVIELILALAAMLLLAREEYNGTRGSGYGRDHADA